MSAIGDPAAPAPVIPTPAPAEPVSTLPVPVTEVDIPADGGFPAPDPVVDPAVPDPAAAAAVPDPNKPNPVKKNAFQARVDTLTARNAEKDRVIAEKEAQLALYKAMAEGKDPAADPNAPPAPANPGAYATKADFDKAVADTAAQIAASDAAKARTGKLLASGNTEFKDFTDRCNVVASLGAGDRPDFMQIVTDPDVITDGHKVIAQLADNPDEAARILALPTVQMTAALVKFQAENSKPAAPRPLSQAPAPIKTIDGMNRGNDAPNDKDDMNTYAAKYRAQQAEKLKSGSPARFARH